MLRILIVTLAFVSASSCASLSERDRVRGDVAALVQHWSDAGEKGDWNAVADTYSDAEGFAWIEQGEVRYPNRAAIIKGLDLVREMSATVQNDVSDIVVTPLGANTAAFHAKHALNVTSAQFNFSSRGVLSGVAVKQHGKWRFLQGAFSAQPEAPL